MKRELFNRGWSFVYKNLGEAPEQNEYKPVDIPHDWMIYDTHNLYRTSDGYYKKIFTLFGVAATNYTLRFEGVYMDSEIYLNGEKIFEWKYGYTTFDVPLINAKEGENELIVKVRYQCPNTRWYSGAGIFRDVWLTAKGENEIVPDGIYTVPVKKDGFWTVEIDTEVRGNESATLKHTVYDADGKEVAQTCGECVLTSETSVASLSLDVNTPHLWDCIDPYLYTLKTELIVDGETVDEVTQNLGFKTIRFDCNEGFFINDRHQKLYGVCMHHDLGALGSAFNKTALRRQFESLREMGVNAIRTSHNPPAPAFMDLADEMGMMIISEAFDMWELKKTDHDYANFFPEWHERDVASWVRRDRNHPSLIMWSIGNEVYDTHASPRGVEVTIILRDLVFKHDYKKMYPVTIGSNYMQWEGAQNCAEHIGTVGYNYTERIYDEHHAKHPDWCIYGSETASTIQSRGTYHFPASKIATTHDDHQCSSLLNCATGWGAVNCEYNITQDRNHKFSSGQFIWTGWDYIGEPTPYWTKNSYFGHSDTAGFPKDSYFAYKAEWAAERAEPFVHLFPYWDFNEGQLIDLFIFSNCAKSELFVNGVSQGIYEHNHTDGDKLSGRWQVPYHKGEIKAVGYDENGNVLCEQIRHSFGDAKKISLKPNKTELLANGLDMIFVEISMLDENGYPVENDRSRVEVYVSGAGRLVGLDNGDSTDYDQYKGTCRKLFNGKLLAMIAAKDTAGDIVMEVRSKGLPTETLVLKAHEADVISGACFNEENTVSEVTGEIPVRKIELSVTSSKMDESQPTVVATAKLYPENTTFTCDDIGFKAITDAGIETNLVKIDRDGNKAIITAMGDGEYRLRAYCKNGSPYEEIISELEMSNSGFGAASFDPYGDIISASLYSEATETLQDVFEGGVQTLWDETFIQFSNVDFGKVGSDEFTVGLYHNSDAPIPFDVTDDMGNLLGSYVYKRPRWWNHYQYQTFKLDKKLVGMQNIRFVFRMQIRFKGFNFTKPSRVGDLISALDRDAIYGDTFSIETDYIGRIGNNVTVEFNGFDFGEDGITKIEICGKTYNANDSIHVRFATEDGANNQIVEFGYTEETETKCFELERVCGKADVKLVFLPGCDFDLKSIKFIK